MNTNHAPLLKNKPLRRVLSAFAAFSVLMTSMATPKQMAMSAPLQINHGSQGKYSISTTLPKKSRSPKFPRKPPTIRPAA